MSKKRLSQLNLALELETFKGSRKMFLLSMLYNMLRGNGRREEFHLFNKKCPPLVLLFQVSCANCHEQI